MKYALLSVYDKTGIVEFAKTLISLKYQIISTGGTAKTLIENKIPVIPIQEITGNPESFDGRMKTISFEIESGILYDRKNKKHVEEADKLKIKPIDIVACNLYPFEQKPTVENIDVGGPTMIRAAAKNYDNVTVVTDPADYEKVAELLQNKIIATSMRREYAAKAFRHLSFYDSQIAKYLDDRPSPKELTLPGRKTLDLRYGENPHQRSAVYFEPGTNSPLKSLKKLAGRELSYVNFTDIAAGLESVRLFEEPAAVVIKHNSPCGIALGKNSAQALDRAIKADPVSAFGGVIVLNSSIDLQTAKLIELFKKKGRGQFDIIAAPKVDKNALDLITNVRKTTGVYTFGKIPAGRKNKIHAKFFDGGYIRQGWDDNLEIGFENWQIVTGKKPTVQQLKQMEIGWKFITRIRSNAVIIVDKKLPMTRGIGSGQTSRILSTKIALEQAGKHIKGAILISDSFFPFDDSVKLAKKYGITAILQQGGSVNDKLTIETANKLGIVMVFTHRRAFSH